MKRNWSKYLSLIITTLVLGIICMTRLCASELIFPCDGAPGNMSQRFGDSCYAGVGHLGEDYGVSYVNIYASASGTVVTSLSEAVSGGWGNVIIIRHENISVCSPVYTLYAHLSERFVGEGEGVSQGQIIGISGNTGVSSGPHIHFGIANSNLMLGPGYCGEVFDSDTREFNGVTYYRPSTFCGGDIPLDLVGLKADNSRDPQYRPCYDRNGGKEHFGLPFDNCGSSYVHRIGDHGWIQDFKTPSGITSAITHKDGAENAYSVWGDIWKYYLLVGGCDGSLGWPVTSGQNHDQIDALICPNAGAAQWCTNACLTRFENGDIYEHRNGSHWNQGRDNLGCFYVYGDIRNKYDSYGGSGSNDLGLPISEQIEASLSNRGKSNRWCTRACLSRFEGGEIYEHLNGDYERAGTGNWGAFVIHGDIRNKYETMGGSGSQALGLPISDQLEAAISNGAAGKGWCTHGCLSRFENGSIYEHLNGNYATAGTGNWGAFEVHGAISQEYENHQGSAGLLGFPISDPVNNNTHQDFEGGYIYINNGIATIVYSTSPVVNNIYPASGNNTSTTQITITGSHFSNVNSVKLGGTAITFNNNYSATQIIATAPAGLAAGTYDITVTNPYGTSGTNASTKFNVTTPSGGGGDIDGDGNVDEEDVVLGLNIASGKQQPTTPQLLAMDRNGNGLADVGDVVLIIQDTRKFLTIKTNRQIQAGNFNFGFIFLGGFIFNLKRRRRIGKMFIRKIGLALLIILLGISLSNCGAGGGGGGSTGNGSVTTTTIVDRSTLSMPSTAGGTPSSVVNVPINLSNAEGIAGFDITVNFDATLLTASNAIKGAATNNFEIQTNPGNGTVRIAMANDTALGNSTITVCNIPLTVANNASAGRSTLLTLSNVKLYNQSGQEIPISNYTLTNGTFTVR